MRLAVIASAALLAGPLAWVVSGAAVSGRVPTRSTPGASRFCGLRGGGDANSNAANEYEREQQDKVQRALARFADPTPLHSNYLARKNKAVNAALC